MWLSDISVRRPVFATVLSLMLLAFGAPLIEIGASQPSGLAIAEGAAGGTQLGKRYVDAAGTLELLCTKPGKGSLAAGGEPLALKAAKPLPSSD